MAGDRWPAAARARSGSSHKHGVEALAWHPRHGMRVVLQRPLPDASVGGSGLHAVHASDGHSWRFAPAGPRSHLKVIELLADGRPAAGRCWIASDSGNGKAPTRLVQFQLALPAALRAPTAPAGHR